VCWNAIAVPTTTDLDSTTMVFRVQATNTVARIWMALKCAASLARNNHQVAK